MTDQDILIEVDRYEAHAKLQLARVDTIVETLFGIANDALLFGNALHLL